MKKKYEQVISLSHVASLDYVWPLIPKKVKSEIIPYHIIPVDTLSLAENLLLNIRSL